MGGGPSVIRRPTTQKSNTELTAALRSNFSLAQQVALNQSLKSATNGFPNSRRRPPYKSWTFQDDSTVYIPATDPSRPGLAEERPQYEITVKLFFLPNEPASCRCAQTREAIRLVLRELKVPSIDLLIVSYPGISFDAEDEEDEESDEAPEVDAQQSQDTTGEGSAEDVDTMLKTWACLEELHDEGVISKLGVAEFGTERLRRFLSGSRIRPRVNQINVRDCCVVPKPLILFAKSERVELLTHNDCTNILPRGTVRELLDFGDTGVGVLASKESSDEDQGLKGDVVPQWVIKFTAVVKNRGVIENKGYFALAELHDVPIE
ncbi:MAG: hypothetical protein M1831_006951 [Alyxoria varia]|nr:MAG: hypothetical protein M1831_006951 [Alyxoria varia]